MPGTRQTRISNPSILREKIIGLVGKKISVVLHDNTVAVGQLAVVNANGIDLINMRLKKMPYSFDQIAEIYCDVIE
jgi:hypothetical protein